LERAVRCRGLLQARAKHIFVFKRIGSREGRHYPDSNAPPFNCKPSSQRNDRQAIDTSEIAVAADQCRTQSQRRRSHPEVVFVQRKTVLLASQLNRRVKVAGPFRDRFALHVIQELVARVLKLGAPPASRKSCDPE